MFMLIVLSCLLVLFVIEAVLTEVEHWGWATTVLIATVVGLHFLHIFSVLDFIKEHTVEALVGSSGYIAVGVVWSFIKWFSFLMGFRDAYREQKEKFFEFKKLPTNSNLTPELEEEFLNGLSDGYRPPRYIKGPDGKEVLDIIIKWNSDTKSYKSNSLNVRPRAAKNKARITSWGTFWPFSMVGTIINDPLRRLWNFLWGQLKALYQHMSDRLLASHPELK